MSDEWDLAPAEEMQGGGGSYLDQPGIYHLLINEVRLGEGPKGAPIEGFSLDCEALGGNVKDCVGKKTTITIWKPNLAGSEKAIAMAKRISAAFFVAVDIVNPNQFGNRVAIDPSKATGHQFLVNLVHGKDKSGGEVSKLLQPNYSDFYHVDDPEVEGIPKDAEALAIIEKQFRHTPEYFAFRDKKKAAPAPATKAAPVADQFADL